MSKLDRSTAAYEYLLRNEKKRSSERQDYFQIGCLVGIVIMLAAMCWVDSL